MVGWVWIVIAALGGSFVTAVALSCCVAAGNADRQMERIEWPAYPR